MGGSVDYRKENNAGEDRRAPLAMTGYIFRVIASEARQSSLITFIIPGKRSRPSSLTTLSLYRPPVPPDSSSIAPASGTGLL